MEKRFEKGSDEWQMFMDFWAMCQKYWIAEDADQYLDERQKAVQDFCNKHNTFFARELAFALLKKHDEEYREKRRI